MQMKCTVLIIILIKYIAIAVYRTDLISRMQERNKIITHGTTNSHNNSPWKKIAISQCQVENLSSFVNHITDERTLYDITFRVDLKNIRY